MLAINLINLWRVSIKLVQINDIQSFICHAPKLTEIRVEVFHKDDDIDEQPKFSDFLAMDKIYAET